jgi:hypothetical protein
MIAYLLHIANRSIKGQQQRFIDAFYRIKDLLLKKYGVEDGYDIQKIPGKKCNSCGGTGHHARYSNMPPYRVYDWVACYHCYGGWYRFPKWICLQRYTFNGYHFHRPLKRHECIHNPFDKDEIGWEVSKRPVISGYIEHEGHRLGKIAIMILFFIYNERNLALEMFKDKLRWKRNKLRWWWWQDKKKWAGWVVVKPEIRIKDYYDDQFQIEQDLPF